MENMENTNQTERDLTGGAARTAGGRLSAMAGVAAPPAPLARDGGIGPERALKAALILAIPFVALHWHLLDWLIKGWMQNSNWSHGPLIPLFSLYLVYSRWGEIVSTERYRSFIGLGLMIGCIALEGFFQVGPMRSFWLYGLAMVGVLFGLVLYLNGWGIMRLLWLPVLFLSLSIPMPGGLYTQMAYPLQELAASGAVGVFRMFDVDITRIASRMTLVSVSGTVHDLTVAEACSGMHLLMAFFALGVAMAYLADRPVWQRVVLVLSGIPIAVFCNVLRVVITCYMYYIDKKELAQGVLHNFTGVLMLIPAFALLWLLSWLLGKLFVEEEDDEQDAEGGSSTVEAGS